MRQRTQPVKNALFLTGFFILIGLLSGCESNQPTGISLSGQTMGTTYHIRVVNSGVLTDQQALKDEVDQLLLGVNQIFSTYIKSSEVSMFNQHRGSEEVGSSLDFINVLAEAMRISDLTSGAYDITVGPLVNLWGFGPDFSEDNVPSAEQIDKALLHVGYQALSYDRGNKTVQKSKPALYIDFSSIAKGYGVDKVVELLTSKGHENFMVEIGGEMRVRGKNSEGMKWRIAVEKPISSQRSIHRVVNVTDTAMATSGDYRNFFEKNGVKYSHTINPKTGMPVQHNLAAVTVLSENCITADALATAFMVLGEKKGYDLAIKHELAVLFLVNEGGEVVERATPFFEAKIKEH
ncbi:MAG: FAD:protein FMN transferase [Cycloclasticus sp.]|nr:FAD:protein FMN transferase [Cycloclasticus sp.]